MQNQERQPVWNPHFNGNLRIAQYIEPPAAAARVRRLKREHYRQFDVKAFEERVAKFNAMDLSDPNFDLVTAVEDVLRQEPGGGYVLSTSWDEIRAGHLLWRARRIDQSQVDQGEVTPSDLWEAPRDVVGPGRLNSANEPVLYTTLGSPLETLHEARVTQPGDSFILVAYEVWKPLILRRIGVSNPDSNLIPEHQKVDEQVSRFVAESLSIPALDDDPRIYTFTRELLRTVYDLEPGWEVGWGYASTIFGPDVINVALEPSEAHSRLRIAAVVNGVIAEPVNDVLHLSLSSFSNGRAGAQGGLHFREFPHEKFSSLGEYFDYVL